MAEESEAPTVSTGRPLTNAERQSRWRERRKKTLREAAWLRRDYEQRVESHASFRLGQLLNQRIVDSISGLSPIEYICLIESMLMHLRIEDRLEIVIAMPDGRRIPVELDSTLPVNLALELTVCPLRDAESESSLEEIP